MTMLTRALGAALVSIAILLPAVLLPTASAQASLDDAARAAVIAKAADALRSRYIFIDVGETAAAKLESQLAAGAYADLGQPRAFAEKLTADLYSVAKDKHLRIMAPGPAGPANGPAPPPPPKNEGGIVRADRLAGNIGYIEVSGFPPPAAFKPAIEKAMAAIGDTRALIIDNRRNGGGSPDSVAYLVSFFLDPAKPMKINDFVNRTPNTKDFTTRAQMSVATPTSYRGKPVYVLTSARTFSGGEEFAYDIQAFKLGTLVGETTGGGANPGGPSPPLGSGLGIFLPGGRPVNPVTGTNWEGVGVIPEIRTPVEDALKVALEKLGEKPASGDIAVLSVARVFEPRTTPTPGLDALARRIMEGDTKGEPALDIMAPGLAQLAQSQHDRLLQTYARLGPLKSLTFTGPGPGGGDAYLAAFTYGSSNISIGLGADGKVASFGIGPVLPQTPEQRAAAFKAIDLNADGKLDRPEYGTMLTTIGYAPQLDNFFAQLDANKDGLITTKEFETDPQ